jgi:GNAT superfamily N-acetyltransferase
MKIDLNKLTYRKMDKNDRDLFIKLRLDFLIEVNDELDEKLKEEIINSLGLYYIKHIPENKFIGIICEYDKKAISTAFLAINEKPANLNFPNGKAGTLLNVYTYPEYRKNGISTKLIEIIIEEAKKLDITEIDLLSREAGENIYVKYGFKESNLKYMKLKLT